MKHLKEPGREVPIVKEYETVVCGGGIAGISAALASARTGAKTLLIEREYLLGGLATAGLVAIYLPLCDGMGRQVSFGIAEELLRYSIRRGSDIRKYWPTEWLEGNDREARCRSRYRATFNPQVFGADVENLLAENKVDILFGTTVCDAVAVDGKITHLIVENKSGRSAVAVKNVVDATGDADIVHRVGEEERTYGPGNVLAAWYYSLQDGASHLHMLGARDVPEDEKKETETPLTERRFVSLEADELTEQVRLSHQLALTDFFRKGELSEAYGLITLPSIPQVRMTRSIVGASTMDDTDDHKTFSDSVGLFSDWRKSGPVYELRFSALHGNKIHNLLCAGRNISVTDAMWDITRVIPVCAVSGEAAGTASALFSDFTDIDLPLLQQKLRENGVVLHEADL